ncbi:hypothetical protein Q8W71_09460 [Methylobacterium sp. NEAU 140]|nr:hypothetical protein [Methylobacterium sp. NEAU 140]MDP4022848.1 hypothetical protein [Methylobacterium sp. NEAU 140]
MEALAVREAVFDLDDPNLVDLVDALLRGLGQAATRPAAAVKRAKAA